ncbi:MAG TPA: M24 family metallopeptidase [Mycobacteriales bacterium]|nr:M24 family metallopeptidase [Mycobacteriales bacterium]
MDERGARLLEAQHKAEELFDAVVEQGLLRPGITERQLSVEVRDLARTLLGVEQHWHKRVVRSGPNSMLAYAANPPDRTIAPDDVIYLDLGPVFSAWEADFGRTYVLGDDPDPRKLELVERLPLAWDEGKQLFDETPDVTGAQLFAFVRDRAEENGWTFGQPTAGHVIGDFPHALAAGDRSFSRIAPANDRPLRGVDVDGRELHWILEVFLVDRDRGFGGFHEELLTV